MLITALVMAATVLSVGRVAAPVATPASCGSPPYVCPRLIVQVGEVAPGDALGTLQGSWTIDRNPKVCHTVVAPLSTWECSIPVTFARTQVRTCSACTNGPTTNGCTKCLPWMDEPEPVPVVHSLERK